MFSGWGIRTLAAEPPRATTRSATTPAPCGRTTARSIALGLRRYGFDEDFTTIFEGLLEAASRFGGHRLPELFGGFAREEPGEPVPYPVACRPQAWAAGSIPLLLRSGLGLSPDALNGRLRIVRPSLPRLARAGGGHGTASSEAPASTCASSAPTASVTLADARVEGDAEVVVL